MPVPKTLAECIDEYRNGCGAELENRHKAITALPEAGFWDAVRCTKPHAPVNLPHTKAWYFKEQTHDNGSKISLRDAIITEAQRQNVLNSPRLKNFTDIFSEVKNICNLLRESGIKGAQQMTMYDIALYIAVRKNIEPTDVYIHQGVTKGAFAIGLVCELNQDYIIPLNDVFIKFPSLLPLVKAKHVENFLCIYHNQLEHIGDNSN